MQHDQSIPPEVNAYLLSLLNDKPGKDMESSKQTKTKKESVYYASFNARGKKSVRT